MNTLSDEFDTAPQETGAGMPHGNKKAGFVGLMIAKKHLRRRPNSAMYNPPPATPKQTPARFNIGAIQNPSAYIRNAFRRRQPAAPAPANVIEHIAPAPAPRRRGRPTIPVAQRSLNRAFRAGERANLTEAQLAQVREREAQRQRASRQRRALARIQAMPEGEAKQTALHNYQITYGVAGAGATGGMRLDEIDELAELMSDLEFRRKDGDTLFKAIMETLEPADKQDRRIRAILKIIKQQIDDETRDEVEVKPLQALIDRLRQLEHQRTMPHQQVVPPVAPVAPPVAPPPQLAPIRVGPNPSAVAANQRSPQSSPLAYLNPSDAGGNGRPSVRGGAFTDYQRQEVFRVIRKYINDNDKKQTKLKVLKELKDLGYRPERFSQEDYDWLTYTINNFDAIDADIQLLSGSGATGGVRPTDKQFLDIVKTSYATAPPKLVSDFELVYATPTVDAWVNEPRKTVVVSVRGTDVKDKQDVYADASLVVNALVKTPRYQTDKASIQQIFSRYDPKQYEYYLVGHSLGGAIINQLMRDFPQFQYGMEYNPAFQPYDLISQQRGKVFRQYTDTDPLYKLGGRLFADKKVVPSRSTVPNMGAVGQLYNAGVGHSLSNFEGAGRPSHFGELGTLTKHQVPSRNGEAYIKGGAVSMPTGEYLQEHRHLVNLLEHPTKKGLKAEAKKQTAEVKSRGLKLFNSKGKVHRGHYHLMSDGTYHTGKTHTARSKVLEAREV